MFEDEDEDFFERELNKDMEAFERMYAENDYQYLDADRIEQIIDHLLVVNQFKKAKWAAEQAIKHFPFNNVFLLRKAQAMSLSGELTEALRILSSLEKLEGQSLDLMLSMASTFSQLRDSDSAIKYFQKALNLAEKEERGEIFIDLAMEYENSNNYKKAIEVLQLALKEDPKNESIVYELAFCYDQQGEYDEAIKCFLNYIDEDPYSYTAWYNLANAYSRVKNYEKAIWAYEYCILVNEEFSPAYFNLGNAFMDKNEYHKALENYQKCIEIDGDDGMAYCSIGECYEELGDLDLAYESYIKSSDLLPQLADAWLGRGIVNELKGNHAKAIAEIKVAVDLESENPNYLHALAGVYENDKQFEKAIYNYIQAIKLDDDIDNELVIDFLKCVYKLDENLVFEYLEEFKDKLLHHPATKLVLAVVYWNKNRRTDALLLLDELIVNSISLARKLFIHFPEMINVSEFTDRIDEIEG